MEYIKIVLDRIQSEKIQYHCCDIPIKDTKPDSNNEEIADQR